MERLAYDSSGQGQALLPVLDNLIEPFAVDVELHPDGEVVRELIAELRAGVIRIPKIASSPESMGEFWFGKVTEVVI